MVESKKNKTFFITVEGGEGVGKTTFVSGLAQELTSLGISFLTTREPGGTPTADRMRQIFVAARLDDPLTVTAEFLLVSAARAQHVEKFVQPNLQKGVSILCDRFVDSSRVYQGELGGIAQNDIEAVSHLASFGLSPDLTFLLDAPLEVMMKRLALRQENGNEAGSRFDEQHLDYHRRLQLAYRKVAEKFPQRFARIDAEESPQKMLQQALKILRERGFL